MVRVSDGTSAKDTFPYPIFAMLVPIKTPKFVFKVTEYIYSYIEILLKVLQDKECQSFGLRMFYKK